MTVGPEGCIRRSFLYFSSLFCSLKVHEEVLDNATNTREEKLSSHVIGTEKKANVARQHGATLLRPCFFRLTYFESRPLPEVLSSVPCLVDSLLGHGSC